MKSEKVARLLLPNFTHLIGTVVFAAVLLMGPRLLNTDGDLGRHLTIGTYILDNARIPTQDLFSHTMPGAELTPHEWLATVLFALAHRVMGLNGVVVLCAAVLGVCFAWVYQQNQQRGAGFFVPLFFCLAAIAAASIHFLARPHLFTMLLLVLWTWALTQNLQKKKRSAWWIFPLLMLAWVNLHGAFIAGFVQLLAFGAGVVWDGWVRKEPLAAEWKADLKFILAAGASSLAATCLNPVGPAIWLTSLGYLQNRYLVAHTMEYLPPDFHNPSMWPFLFLICLSLLALGIKSWKPSASGVFLLAGWTLMGLYSARNIPLYAIVVTPLLSEAFACLPEEFCLRTKQFQNWLALDQRLAAVQKELGGSLFSLLVGLALTAALQSGLWASASQANRFSPKVFPAQAVDYLVQNPIQGKMFNYFTWGGYLLYRLWPEQQVFIDGQTDFYGEALTRQYEQVLTLAPGWEDVLRQYDVRWVIFPVKEALSVELSKRAEWKAVYLDEVAGVWLYEP